MPNSYFSFKQFTIYHDRCAMKVATDSCLFGAWVAAETGGSQAAGRGSTLLDVGCGTGLLSLMIAQKNKVEIDAIEIDSEAAEQAKENIEASPWKERITIINEDVLQWKRPKKYDVIISNPPFYEGDLKSGRSTKNIAHHDKGLRLEELLQFIKKRLTNDGLFYLLLPFKRETALDSLLAQFEFHLQKKVIVKQTTAHAPFRIMLQASNKKSVTVVEEIWLKNSQQQYTEKFASLLKDYYLHL